MLGLSSGIGGRKKGAKTNGKEVSVTEQAGGAGKSQKESVGKKKRLSYYVGTQRDRGGAKGENTGPFQKGDGQPSQNRSGENRHTSFSVGRGCLAEKGVGGGKKD